MERNQDMEDIARQSLLWDFYGSLLTPRQRQVLELYTQENFSLAEIAEEFGISRQGVHDTLRSARKALDGYEEKLGLLRRYMETAKSVEKLDERIRTLIENIKEGRADIESAAGELAEIREALKRLEE